MGVPTIAKIKMTLDHVKPTVMRRVEVPLDTTLDRLHLTIQAAMGWTDSHLHELRAGNVSWSIPYPDQDWSGDFIDGRKVRLHDILPIIHGTRLAYIYDFDDDWEHTIKIERLVESVPGVLYPRLVEVVGACPPEDCGGPLGYAELVEAIRDPSHERHDDMVEWIGEDFDPAEVGGRPIGGGSRRPGPNVVAQTGAAARVNPSTRSARMLLS